jgi:hypothetical protein
LDISLTKDYHIYRIEARSRVESLAEVNRLAKVLLTSMDSKYQLLAHTTTTDLDIFIYGNMSRSVACVWSLKFSKSVTLCYEDHKLSKKDRDEWWQKKEEEQKKPLSVPEDF